MSEKHAPYGAAPGPGITVIYDIARPYSGGRIVVYGDADNAHYEFRITDAAGHCEYDSAEVGKHGMGYGNSAIALRDALIHDTD